MADPFRVKARSPRLAAERIVKTRGGRCLAVTNVIGSTLAREVDDILQLKAGPEIVKPNRDELAEQGFQP